MAQLQWRPVDAPQLDTRDLALAGRTMDSAFGRFSDILAARDARLNKDATDARAVQLLAAQTPEELAAAQAQAAIADPTGRADIRQLMGIANQRGQQLTAQALDQSTLSLNQDKQAESNDLIKNGALYRKALEAANVGDHAGVDAIFDQVKAGGGGQAAASVTKDLMDQFSGFRKYELDKRQTDSQIANDGARTANDAARLGMTQTEFNQGQQDRKDGLAGDAFGVSAAESLRVLDATSAMAKLHEQAEYRNAPEAAKKRMEAAFTSRYAQLTGSTGGIDETFAGTHAKALAVQAGLTADANRAANAQTTPLAKATRLATADQPDLTLAEASKQVASLLPGWSTQSGTDATIGQIQQKVNKALEAKGLPGNTRYEDIVTAANASLNKPGFWNTVLPGDNGAVDHLTDFTQQIVENRAKGYGQNLETDLAQATAPFTTKSAEITKLEAEQVRWERAVLAGSPGIDTPAAKAAHAASTERLNKLLTERKK